MTLNFETVLLAIGRLLLAAFAIAFAQPILAQATTSAVITNDGVIDGSTTCTGPANPLVRNFTVTDSFTVGDVDLGVFATHSWRGDIRVTLEAPDGTRVQLVDGEVNNTNGDNLNVLLDDAAGTTVNTTNITAAHSTTNPPPFENLRSPNSALSAFNGVASNGTWRLEICDLFPNFDDGTFRHAELYLTEQLANFADLSLTKVLVGSPPVQGGTAVWRLTVTNDTASNLTGTGITVGDTLPAGFTFTSASGDGSFNSGNGQWSVPDLAPGTSATITISGTVSSAAGNTITNVAEIIAANEGDPDSAVNNANTLEDDFASASFVVQAGNAPGIPPILSCPAGFSVFDWGAISGWTNGSVDNTYGFASFGNIRFQLTNDGAFVNNAGFGGQSPNVTNVFEGGLDPAQDSLTVLADQVTTAGEVDIAITLPRSFTGLQFTIFDVDFAAGQFTDRVEVVGSNNGGAAVFPVLTNGNVNQVTGNVATGIGASASPEALGNVVVTFTQPVDSITVTYGNVTSGTPGIQGVGLHDITVCNPFTTLSVSKISSVISDPVNGTNNPKAIPGALIEYLITVTNTGSDTADTDSVVVWDDGPPDAKLCRVGEPSGPIVFSDPGSNSGLTFSFASLGSGSDNLEFSSNDAADFGYTPNIDPDGCDENVTDFRVRPAGDFAAGGNFTLRARYIVK